MPTPSSRPTEANEETVTEFLAFSAANPSSIRNCFESARLNARAVRTALTIEMWDAINGAWLELKRWGNGPARARNSRASCVGAGIVAALDGSAYRTMLRNDAYWFSRLGVYIERADNTARILDVKYHLLLPADEPVGGPLDYYQWSSILRTVSALTAYHWVYRENIKPWLVADLLILGTRCRGRSPVATRTWCRTSTASPMPMAAKARPSGRPVPSGRGSEQQDRGIFQTGLHEFIDEFVEDNNRLGTALAQQYLLYGKRVISSQ